MLNVFVIGLLVVGCSTATLGQRGHRPRPLPTGFLLPTEFNQELDNPLDAPPPPPPRSSASPRFQPHQPRPQPTPRPQHLNSQHLNPQHLNPQHLNPQPSPQPTPHPEVRSEYKTPIPIIRLDKQQAIDGSYKTSYETGNNIIAEETGFLKNIGVENEEALVQHGSYTYTDPDGNVVTVTYTADEGGFRPVGAHLPTPPPVPEEIQRGLDIIFEQIRLQAEKDAKEKQFEKTQQESANYPSEPANNRRFRR